ncbi:MAG: hypothetical protein LE180_04020, partial [Endomicrobium sp.]|uniref:hypothetical protein n=1 Tax=Candidatus Endomicrobiellum pyrsonymphae TaxID=1408203 RepID=UPI003588844F|nr:hypothetical protein [Endomicrobium sp.]
MMTLQFKKCVSLFVCLSLLFSACGKPSKKASGKAGELARNEVKLAYDLCGINGEDIVKARKPIKSIGEMDCVTKDGNTTCTKKDDAEFKCELKKVELCNDEKEDCKPFEFDKTKVPCDKSSDEPEGACLPKILREKPVPWSCQIRKVYNLLFRRCT